MTENQSTYKWIYHTDSRVGRASPAVAADGTTYVGGNDCRLHAISSDGTLLWKRSVEGVLGNSIASVADDGTIYVSSETGRFYSFDSGGRMLWVAPNDWLAVTSAAIACDGGAILGVRKLRGCDGTQDRLIAVNRLGQVVWEIAVHGGISDAPAICTSRAGYVGTGYGDIYKITCDGEVAHHCRPGGRISSALAVRADGVVLAATQDGCLYAISPEMEVLWRYQTGRIISHSSPAIAEDGTIYFGSWDHCLYALTESGELKWKFATGLYVSSSPAVAADGTIYFESQDRHFYALRQDGTLKWKLWTDSPVVSSPAITDEGVVLLCGRSRLMAIDERNGGPARSAWPMLLGSARRNGRQSGQRGGTAIAGRIPRREFAIRS